MKHDLQKCPPEDFRKLSSEKRAWITPTNLRSKLISNLGDYGKKASMKRACNKKGRAEMTLPLKVVLVG
jgi:hypothetical protein